MSRMARSNGSLFRRNWSASFPLSTSRGSMPHLRACSVRTRRLVGLSSTISRRRPASCGWVPFNGAGNAPAVGWAWIVKWNVDPWPRVLSTHILPPISSDRLLLIAKPSPVPPYCRVVEASTWLKDLKSRSSLSAGMPMPVSRTEK